MNDERFVHGVSATREATNQDGSSPLLRWALALLVLIGAMGAGGCAGVRPEQRAILADPTMVHDEDPLEAEARQHVFDNREGSFGGSSVRGGGCGCN